MVYLVLEGPHRKAFSPSMDFCATSKVISIQYVVEYRAVAQIIPPSPQEVVQYKERIL